MKVTWRLIAVAMLCATSTPELEGQGVVRGVVFDSLRTSRPLVAAEVVLLASGQSTLTDSAGRFEFRDLPAGAHTVAVTAAWLDSLRLPMISAVAHIDATRPIADMTLATPALTTLLRTICGGALVEGTGILLGEVRDPHGNGLAGANISARWRETAISGSRIETRDVSTEHRSDDSGMFKLCGVPFDSRILLTARTGISAGVLLELEPGLGIRRRDVLLDPSGRATELRGYVRGINGEAVSGAAISLLGDTITAAMSGPDGSFRIATHPRRSVQLQVRSIGRQPVLVDVEPEQDPIEVEIRLAPLNPVLDTVRITGRLDSPEQRGFRDRKQRLSGTFMDENDLAKYPQFSADILASRTPRSGVAVDNAVRVFRLRRGTEPCKPRYFVDGHSFGRPEAAEEIALLRLAKRLEVYTAANAPQEFTDFDGCGVVVIWSR